MLPVPAWAGILAIALGLGGGALGLGGGCRNKDLSGKDLQDLKREEIQKDPELTPQAKYRILGIQARTESEFLREVRRIQEEERAGKKSQS